MIKRLILVSAVIQLSACTTIHFTNGKNLKSGTKHKKWHHNVAHGLYEASEPVSIESICNKNNWVKVSTKVSPENGLAGGAVNAMMPFVELWSPKTVEVTCGKTDTTKG